MTATLIERLPLLAGAPGGIDQVRALVQELAIAGNLLPQEPSDEPAESILAKVAQAKAKSGIKAARLGAGATSAMPPPAGWVATTFEPIALEVATGPFGSLIHQSDYVRGGVPLVNPSHMVNGRIVPDPDVALPPSMAEQLASYRLQAGDMVMARRGEVGRVAVVTAEQEGWLCGTGSFRLRFTDDLSRGFLHLIFRCPSTRKYLSGAAVGTTMVNLNHGVLSRMPVCLPPLPEQVRIVAKVDELMALCDRLEARQQDAEAAHARLVQALLDSLTQARDADDFQACWRRMAVQFESLFTTDASVARLRAVVLHLAVSGRLVRQQEGDGSAADLLLATAALRKKPRAGRLAHTGSRPNTVRAALPEGWVSTTVGEVLICRDGERIPVSQTDRARRAKLYDYYGASGVIDKIDGFLFDKPLLLVGEDGANLINRSTPVAFIARGKYWVNNHAHVLDGVDEDLLGYMALFFNAIDLKPYVTGTAQPKLNQAKLNAIPVLLPPPGEQRRIVAKVTELLALCDQLKARIAAARAKHAQLAEALVAQAVAA